VAASAPSALSVTTAAIFVRLGDLMRILLSKVDAARMEVSRQRAGQ
jgi:hypothetical protein